MPDDQTQRRTQLMGCDGDKIVLQPVEFDQLILGVSDLLFEQVIPDRQRC
jgi:hypothetical protein